MHRFSITVVDRDPAADDGLGYQTVDLLTTHAHQTPDAQSGRDYQTTDLQTGQVYQTTDGIFSPATHRSVSVETPGRADLPHLAPLSG